MRSDAKLLLLNSHAVNALLDPADVLGAVRDAFEVHSRQEGRVFPVIREALSTGGVFGIKAGDIASQDLLGFKAAGFWPQNRQLGAEPHQATVMLFDPHTGRPLCVMDGNTITTVRTGAAGALGLLHVARADSATLTVFGTGVQARSQLAFALQVMPLLRHVHYVTVDRQPDPCFEKQFAERCQLTCGRDANEAVSQSDIVITATPGGGALFDVGAVRSGTHLNCVGADTRGKRELPPGLLASANAIVVDDRQQAAQLGELQWAPELPCVELGDVITGTTPFARKPSDITVFDMTGIALQDMTVARLLYQKAMTNGIGQAIDWPW